VKITLVSVDHPPNIGGIASHVANLATGLADLGQDVTVVGGFEARRGSPPSGDSGVDMCLRPVGPTRASRLAWAGWAARELRRRPPPEVLHWHSPFFDAAAARPTARRAGLCVFTQHTAYLMDRLGSPGWRWMFSGLNRRADVLLAPERSRVEVGALLGIDPDRRSFVPNGVDTERFHPGAADRSVLQRLGVPNGVPVHCCPRRLATVHGVEYLVDALPRILREVPDALLLVVGGSEPPLIAAIEARARERSVDAAVVFAGPQPPQAMPGILGACDLVVIPSLAEATSVAALESMAVGTAVVASAVGGLLDIIEDGRDGVLVPPRDVDRLGQAVVDLLNDPIRRAKVAAAGRSTVEQRFTSAHTASAILGAYEDARRTGG